jgi:RNA recognition motif-containing protein
MKLLVRNLTRNTTEAELKALFQPFGTVQSCTLVLDKDTQISKGFGFVEMPKVGEAKAAMKNLNGSSVSGSKIRVKKSEAPAVTPENAADNTQDNA